MMNEITIKEVVGAGIECHLLLLLLENDYYLMKVSLIYCGRLLYVNYFSYDTLTNIFLFLCLFILSPLLSATSYFHSSTLFTCSVVVMN